jgi:hypothetical protein
MPSGEAADLLRLVSLTWNHYFKNFLRPHIEDLGTKVIRIWMCRYSYEPLFQISRRHVRLKRAICRAILVPDFEGTAESYRVNIFRFHFQSRMVRKTAWSWVLFSCSSEYAIRKVRDSQNAYRLPSPMSHMYYGVLLWSVNSIVSLYFCEKISGSSFG